MKIIKLIGLVGFLVMLGLTSCEEKTSIEPGKAILTGEIQNPSQNTILLLNGDSKISTPVVDGVFKYEIDLANPTYFTLRYVNAFGRLHLSPGDEVEVQFDAAERLRTYKYTGPGGEKNNYLQEKTALDRTLMNQRGQLLRASYEEYAKGMDGHKSQILNLLNGFTGIRDKHFLTVEKLDVEYDFAMRKVQYQNTAKQGTPAGAYFSFADQIDWNNELNLESDRFAVLVKQYLAYEADKLFKANPGLIDQDGGYTKTHLEVIEKKFKGPVKSLLISEAINDHLRYFGVNGMNELLAKYRASNPDPDKLKKLERDYQKWAHLEKGKPAPTWSFTDINGEMKTLADFKGKVVYIDVWATWCGPCKREIPFLEKLQEQFHGNNDVVFTSISIDRNKQAWENMVHEKALDGVQLYASSASNLQTEYNITGIPRFMLIDEEGKILNIHAPRPSSGKVKPLIESHLGMKS